MAQSATVCCGRDCDRQDLIPEIPGNCDPYTREVRRRAEGIGISSPSFKKDRDRLTDLFVVKGESFGSVEAKQKIGTFLHRCRRDPLFQSHCSRSRARGVWKYVKIGEWKIGRGGHRILKRGISLPRESYQDISSKAEVGNGYMGLFNQLDVAFDRMASIHGLQNLIVSALQRDMEIGTEFLRRGEEIKQFLADCGGFN